MKFSLDFIKEFVEVKVSPEKIASLLTMSGLEIVSTEKVGSDTSFEAEVTSNRPDLLSIAGIAYEVGALLGKKSKLALKKVPKQPVFNIPIVIESRKDCPCYFGRLIKGVKIEPSPKWLRQVLKSCGIASVNNVVDITNYCMLKWGQPLHAFDLSKVEEKIIVRRAYPQEKLICIDNKERILNPEALVIADKKSVLALAGVMGGKNSEVLSSTRDIFLEAAIFSPILVRRARRFLGINTESSYRFERGVNPVYLEQASWEAAYLIGKLAKGKISGCKKAGSLPLVRRPWIKFEVDRMNGFLGTQIKQAKAGKILNDLNFEIEKKKTCFLVKAPSFRQDIKASQDLYEEVVRIWGYHNIKESLPLIRKEIRKEESFYKFKESIRSKAICLGFKEVVTFSIIPRKNVLSDFLQEPVKTRGFFSSSGVTITNPLRLEEDLLRPLIFPGMLEVLRYNVYRKERSLKFFEIADSYVLKDNSFRETAKLCLGWHSDTIDDFYAFKGKAEFFLKALGIENPHICEEENPLFSNFCSIDDFAWVGVLRSDVAEKIDLAKVFLAEFDLEKISKKAKEVLFEEINYLPWVERDISLALREDIRFKEIETIIKNKTASLFRSLEVTDVYKGEKIPRGFTGFTLRIFYQHKTKTLEAQEVDSVHFSLRAELSKLDGLLLR
ncbi:MAG: phenylalanine--tRNA ligase subunit beta [Candidatus Omnitrophica bacterium]|nr:phenylalanine--tRNA ligase subunit beta [Candidatus Omnitrophota bacterium]